MTARILFDLDGTLIDSAPDIQAVANGPTSAPGPTRDERSTEYQTRAPSPISESTTKHSGPTAAPGPTRVDPSRWTPAYSRAPAESSTPASM